MRANELDVVEQVQAEGLDVFHARIVTLEIEKMLRGMGVETDDNVVSNLSRYFEEGFVGVISVV